MFGFGQIQGDPKEVRYDSPVHLQQIKNLQSPQPCVSPSSLINNIYADHDGQSAPVFHGFGDSSTSKSHTSAAALKLKQSKMTQPQIIPSTVFQPAKNKPTHTPFGMFNWDWESSENLSEAPKKSSNEKPSQ